MAPGPMGAKMAQRDEMAVAAASYIYLSRGWLGARKRVHSGIAVFHEDLEPLFGRLTFDFDFFGLRSSAVDQAFDAAVQRGYLTKHLYISTSTPAEPPHVPYVLTVEGALVARQRLAQLPQEQVLEMAARLFALGWLPQGMAVGLGLHSSGPPAENEMPAEPAGGPTASFRVYATPFSLRRLHAFLRGCPILTIHQARTAPESLTLTYSLNREFVEKKYGYLAFTSNDLAAARERLAKVHDPISSEDLDALRQVGTPLDTPLARRTSPMVMLMRDSPGLAARWKEIAADLLAEVGRRQDRITALREERVSEMARVADLTVEHPMTTTITLSHGVARMRRDVGAWGGMPKVADLVERRGKRALVYMLEDPADFLSYLAAIHEDIEDVAAEHAVIR